MILGFNVEDELVVDSNEDQIQYASLSIQDGMLRVRDLGSGAEIKVNGKLLKDAVLNEGDRLRIGSTSMMVITLTRFSPSVAENPGWTQFLTKSQKVPVVAAPVTRSLTGSLKEVPLVDILQFLTQSRMNGVLRLELDGPSIGKIHISEGRMVDATWEGQAPVGAMRILFRLLRQTAGTFVFGPPEGPTTEDKINQTADSLLLEAMQGADEIGAYFEQLPALETRIRVIKPSGEVHLSDLSKEQLDVLQEIFDGPTIQQVLDRHPFSDLEAVRHLKHLVESGIVVPH